MSTFFAGNDKLILVKKQVDKATEITDWSGARAFRVYEWTKLPVREIGPLEESDRSIQQGASHVTTVGPGVTFGVYGRPTEMSLICEALLGANYDDTTGPPYDHTAIPDQDSPYYSILEIDPYACTRYEGCRLTAATFTAQDTGQTELRITGLAWLALNVTLGITPPDPEPVPVDELPFLFAECAVKYGGSHLGTTSQFTLNVNRNSTRIQADNGFEALDIVHGKFQADGSVTRYVQDDDTLRAIDTGTTGGTAPTSTIYTEAFEIDFSRDAGALAWVAASDEIAYETREAALNLDGTPIAEVLGFRTQPQSNLADNLTMVTTNARATA